MGHDNPLALPLSSLKGVSQKIEDNLTNINIFSIFDLLLRPPRKIIHQEKNPGIAHMEEGHTYVAKVSVLRLSILGIGNKKRLEAIVEDETGRLSVVFFGGAVNFSNEVLSKNKEIFLIGEIKSFMGRKQMVHPKLKTRKNLQEADSNETAYSQMAGLSSLRIKQVIELALNKLNQYEYIDHIEDNLLRKLNLNKLRDAFFSIHGKDQKNPPAWDDKKNCPNFRRIAFEEILAFYNQIFIERMGSNSNKGLNIPPCKIDKLCAEILPFNPTLAQQKAMEEIITDMASEKAMSRLLQGDVGSGKTAVSAIAALNAVKAGSQVALMAPTEILAEQLSKVFIDFFDKKNFKICLITSSTKNKERKLLAEKIKDNKINIVIGTHALLSDDIVFKKLGLIIIDEQHRFGVKQRALLVQEAEKRQGFCPHLLVMTATPIPRSLALTYFGDLDLSVINERPPGRISVTTKILNGEILISLQNLCERIIATGQKAFIIFPLVAESEKLDLEDATNAYRFLKEKFGDNSCELLHGKMKAEEKLLAMQKFKDNKIRFLVSTTVVEVGVDVPDATCIAIVHPERFGLAQLHQLRGRVGRGKEQSYCFLITNIQNKFSTSAKRLKALCQTDDGFLLAKKDLELRGAGEFLGIKQSGLPNFFVFNHEDFADLISSAKSIAKQLVAKTAESHGPFAHLIKATKAHFS